MADDNFRAAVGRLLAELHRGLVAVTLVAEKVAEHPREVTAAEADALLFLAAAVRDKAKAAEQLTRTGGDAYAPGHRPSCAVCGRGLAPAESATDGEPAYRGFRPCPEHPRAAVTYPDGSAWQPPPW